jgi:NAD(P)-dependent dehydrogenase (short-subunit alcohol dehydrogenase family)
VFLTFVSIQLINNAGIFPTEEQIDSLDFESQLKTINISAVGQLRIASALYNAKLLKEGSSKIINITSQGGSVSWRFTQNASVGGDYGHHMSKAAANMASVLLSEELKKDNICVVMLHPGFNKSDMTKKYEQVWEEEGAVDTSVGAKRVLYEIGKLDMSLTGKFFNCEDGLEIPF